ncbi:hypothetical protein CONPUDRAFT_138355 [Coniophora puteana RWD-64-598 SS2]|uniref:Velvet domain-containing protein n=1 Tax=Coniophora puteana (strain RWD-64-598) TaxID=741705 RepID=A0A5M3MIX6_CONPW|nr:uncharacterized protein CONPUDRAFT_138355 [Coniophora puteana RWD-64-598 SS2]EIW79198.1 hypothetical protein CONPUDRAFT_138355 [Coniophora puteana RWD-64-598 SS2]
MLASVPPSIPRQHAIQTIDASERHNACPVPSRPVRHQPYPKHEHSLITHLHSSRQPKSTARPSNADARARPHSRPTHLLRPNLSSTPAMPPAITPLVCPPPSSNGDGEPKANFQSLFTRDASPRSASSNTSVSRSPPAAWASMSSAGSSGTRPYTSGSSADNNGSSTSAYAPRVHLSSFLNDSQTRSYELDVVQHPQRTAEFGSATLSRLPLSPPIVVQLIVKDRFGNSIIPDVELPFLIAHLSLYSEDGTRQLDMGTSPDATSTTAPRRRLLYGNLVSSPQKLRDLQGRLGLYFLFPDVSIRYRGRFQLGISLLRISIPSCRTDAAGVMSLGEQGTVLAQARTRSFDVLAHEDYVAPGPTRLTQSFLRQGARINVFTPSSP